MNRNDIKKQAQIKLQKLRSKRSRVISEYRKKLEEKKIEQIRKSL